MSQLEAAKKEVVRLEALLRDAKQRRDEIIVEEAPFKVGDVVEMNGGGYMQDWEPVIVRRVRARWGEKAGYFVSKRRKNGEWMTREQEAWGELRPVSA